MPTMSADKSNNNKRKVNKNAVLRRSKLSFKSENSEIKVEQSELPGESKLSFKNENSKIKMEQSEHIGNGLSLLHLSSPELDGEADSALGSITPSTTSDSIEEDKLDLEPENKVFAISGSASTYSEKPNFIVPKFPVLQSTRTECDRFRKRPVQQKKAQPTGIAAPLSVSSTTYRNEETDDIRTDGPQSEVIPPDSRDPISSMTKLCTSSSSTELNQLGGMLDFVILHTDEDTDAACNYRIHLLRDIGFNDLKVDLLSNIDAGKSEFQSLDSLHERYRYILTYVTDNLGSDRYCRFLQQIIITCGLREANGKEDRVVPVFTKKEPCNIIEISVLNGFQYFRFCSGEQHMKNMYIHKVKQLVERGRTMFP